MIKIRFEHVFFIVALLIVISLYIQQNAFAYSKNYTVELICSITNKTPFYDCSEKWGLVIHDMWAIQCLGDNYWTIGGCAYWDTKSQNGCLTKGDSKNEACQRLFQHPELQYKKYIEISTIVKDSYGYPLVWHELKHLVCKCDWHKDLKADDSLDRAIDELMKRKSA